MFVERVCPRVETHQLVSLEFVHFTVCKFYCRKEIRRRQSSKLSGSVGIPPGRTGVGPVVSACQGKSPRGSNLSCVSFLSLRSKIDLLFKS